MSIPLDDKVCINERHDTPCPQSDRNPCSACEAECEPSDLIAARRIDWHSDGTWAVLA